MEGISQINMENKSAKLDKALKISIIVGILAAVLLIGYCYIYFLPKKEESLIEQKNKELSFEVSKYKEEKDREIENDNEEDMKELKRMDQLENCINEAKEEMNNSTAVWSKYKRDNCDSEKDEEISVRCLEIVNTKLKEIVNTYDQQEKGCYVKFK